MSDSDERKPAVEQVRELVQALRAFAFDGDRGNANSHAPWDQEQRFLPHFLSLADALSPLRGGEGVSRGWPGSVGRWLPGVVRAVAKTFDVVAYSWGWGELLKSPERRDAYIREREDEFRIRFLLPIRDAARACCDNISDVDRPPLLDGLSETVPPIGCEIDVWTHDPRCEPLYQAFDAKRKAFLLGDYYPTLSRHAGLPEDHQPEDELGEVLKAAYVKLKAAVDEAGGKIETGPNVSGLTTTTSDVQPRLDAAAGLPKEPSSDSAPAASNQVSAGPPPTHGPGDAQVELDAVFDTLVCKREWTKTNREIIAMARIAKSTFYVLTRRGGRLANKYQAYRCFRSSGRGPVRANEI